MKNISVIRYRTWPKMETNISASVNSEGFENKDGRYLLNFYERKRFEGVSGYFTPDFWEHEIRRRIGVVYGRIYNTIMFLG
jgi:hypothetical protein